MRWMVVVLVLLAGCSAAPPPVVPPATAAADPTSSAAPAPMNALPVVLPVHWDGHTKEGAWVCTDRSGASACPAGQQVAPDGQYVTRVPYVGRLLRIDLNLSWTADPTQTGLVIAVSGNSSAGHGTLGWAQGDSPLSLSIDTSGLGMAPDASLVLAVWPEGKTPTSPSLFVDATQQAFTVGGTLTALPPAVPS